MDKGKVKIAPAPSILAADFSRLGEHVTEAERAGADRIHVDIMDGHFVPNISMGAPVVQSLRQVTELRLEIHMMITDPDYFVDEFVKAGSDSFIAHWTIKAAIDEAVPVPVLTSALFERFESRGEAGFANKLLSAMRYQFGGHLEKAAEKA